MGFECRLGRRYRAIIGERAVPPRTRHRKYPSPPLDQIPPEQSLSPVDKTVCHDIDRHLHLGLVHRILGAAAYERLECPERQGVNENPHGVAMAAEPFLDLIQRFRPFDCVGRVDVVEDRLAPRVLDVPYDLLNARHRRLAVEVHPEDVHPRPGKLNRRRAAEPARRSQDKRPISRSETGFLFHGIPFRFENTNVIRRSRFSPDYGVGRRSSRAQRRYSTPGAAAG